MKLDLPQMMLFRIDLEDEPLSRTLLLPSQAPLTVISHLIQAAFGWNGSHGWEFSRGDTHYTIPDDDMPSGFGPEGYREQDATKTTLADLFSETGAQLEFTYDFGDCCTHLMTYLGRRNGSVACYDTEGVYAIDDAHGMRELIEDLGKRHNTLAYREKKEWLDFIGSSPEEALYVPTCMEVTSQMLELLHMIGAEQYFTDAQLPARS